MAPPRMTLERIDSGEGREAYVRKYLKASGTFTCSLFWGRDGYLRESNTLGINLRGAVGAADCLEAIIRGWGIPVSVNRRTKPRPVSASSRHRPSVMWEDISIKLSHTKAIFALLEVLGWPETPIGKERLDSKLQGLVRHRQRLEERKLAC